MGHSLCFYFTIQSDLVFDHQAVEIPLILLSVLACAIWTYRRVRGSQHLVRIPVQAISLLLIPISSLLLAMDGCAALWDAHTESVRLYSPDRKHAIVVRDTDSGALGGGTAVELYSYLGFRQDVIADGEWKIVQAQDVQWISNSEVVLHYDNEYRNGPSCHSAASVRVVCVPKP